MKHYLLTLIFFILCWGVNHAYAEEYRSAAVLHQFRVLHPCPGGINKGSRVKCRGYILDHIRPLDCGGADSVQNLQWQTVYEAHKKDKWERNGKSCKHRTHGTIPPGVILNY